MEANRLCFHSKSLRIGDFLNAGIKSAARFMTPQQKMKDGKGTDMIKRIEGIKNCWLIMAVVCVIASACCRDFTALSGDPAEGVTPMVKRIASAPVHGLRRQHQRERRRRQGRARRQQLRRPLLRRSPTGFDG